jgi:hypothetical protein
MCILGKVENLCTRLEKVLNVVGYLPLASRGSGAFRMIYGRVQMVAFLVIFVVSNMKRNEYMAARSFYCLINGMGNVARGTAESYGLFGGLVCVFYDYVLKKRYKYPGEGSEFPIMKNYNIFGREEAPAELFNRP